MALAFAALSVSLLGASACSSPPGYVLSWTLVANEGELDSAPALDSVRQCAEVGVSQVRVTAELGGIAVSETEFPCFPGATVEGPSLEPGTYTLVVEGLRRNGDPWDFDPEETEDEQRIAYAEAELVVVDGQTPSKLDFVLRAPPECDDGIDNDGDGRVDASDPACLSANPTTESTDGSVTLLQTSLRMLSPDSTLIRPADLGVRRLQIEVPGAVTDTGDEVSFEIFEFDLDYTRSPFQVPLLSEAIVVPGADAESYSVTMTGLDAQGNALTSPVEAELLEGSTPQLVLQPEQAGFFIGEFILRPDTFLEPLSYSLGFVQRLRLSDDNDTQACALQGQLAGLDDLVLRVRRTDTDTFVDTATLGLSAAAADAEDLGDGWIRFACPVAAVVSSPLEWGAYTLELEGRVGDETCFTSGEDAIEAIPGDTQNIILDRVLVDGIPPEACRECNDDADCGDPTLVCENNYCVPQTFSEDG